MPSGQSLPPSSASTTKGKKHTCEHCGKEFSKLGDLKDHKRNKHPSEGDEPKPYCDTCKKSFSSKSNLKMHMNSKHQKQFIHNCDKCAYGTNNSQTMTSHKIREHTSKEDSQELEKFKCSFCSKEFVTKQLLKKHLYSANCAVVEKNYECTDCKPSKWIKSAESLEKHRKQYHTGEIPLLKCTYQNYDQTCVNAGSLKKHIEWHKDIERKKKER